MTETPSWASEWIAATGGSLSDSERTSLIDFDDFVADGPLWSERLGRVFVRIALEGPKDDPTVAVFFRDERQRPGVTYAYRWHLRNADNDPLHLLANAIDEDMSSTPGLPRWEPSPEGVVDVDVHGERYWQWPQDWDRLRRARGG